MLVCFFAIIGFAIRPQMLGYFLLILELIVLHLGRTRSPRWFFALPPLFALWVNLHGSCFSFGPDAGVAFYAVSALSSVLRRPAHGRAPSWGRHVRRMPHPGSSAVQPSSRAAAEGCRRPETQLVLYPFRAMGSMTVSITSACLRRCSRSPFLLKELQSALGMLGVLAAIVILVVLRRTALFFDEALFLAAAAYLAGNHRRLLFVFGIIAAPILCRLLADTWDNYHRVSTIPQPMLFLSCWRCSAPRGSFLPRSQGRPRGAGGGQEPGRRSELHRAEPLRRPHV